MTANNKMDSWPNKEDREKFEINEFITAYKKLSRGRNFEVVSRQERPDYVVVDAQTGEKFSVELTSVYLNDYSVIDGHKKPHDGPVDIPYNPEEIAGYKNRLISAIAEKNRKAGNYNKDYPLILSLYVNEYCAVFMDAKVWQEFIEEHEEFIDATSFVEIVLWNLPHDGVLSIIPARAETNRGSAYKTSHKLNENL